MYLGPTVKYPYSICILLQCAYQYKNRTKLNKNIKVMFSVVHIPDNGVADKVSAHKCKHTHVYTSSTLALVISISRTFLAASHLCWINSSESFRIYLPQNCHAFFLSVNLLTIHHGWMCYVRDDLSKKVCCTGSSAWRYGSLKVLSYIILETGIVSYSVLA